MKRFLTLIFLSPLLALAQKKLSVTGKITGLKEGSRVCLDRYNNPN